MAIDRGKWAHRAYVGIATASVIVLAAQCVAQAERMDTLALRLYELKMKVDALDLSDQPRGSGRKLIEMMRRYDEARPEGK